MFNIFSSVSRFTAQGLHIMDFMNAIRESDIVCSWLGSKKDIYFGKAYTKDIKKLSEMANQFEVQFQEKSKKGLFHIMGKYKKRYGILLGLLMCLSIWIVLSNVVVTIEVRGNESISEEIILSNLEEIGIKKWAYIPNIDFNSCERKLKLSNSDIAWVSIRNNKGKIVVRLDEMVKSPEMLHDNTPCNLVAKCSASIVSVSVLNGQLMTPIGNGVAENEVLISGVCKNEKEVVRYVHAMGSIIGEYTEEIVLTQPLNETLTEISENQTIYKELDLFGLRIPLYVGKKDTSNCYIQSNLEYFKLFDNNIPIGIYTTDCKKYVQNQVTYSEDDAKNILQSRKETYEKNFLKDIKIVDVVENYTIDDEKVSLSLKYTLQGDICKETPIFLR